MGTGIIRNTVSKAWNGIKSFFGGSSDEISRDVGSSDSFEIERANAKRIQKMNEELLDYSRKYSQKSAELEQDVFEQIDDVLERILDSVKEIENVKIDGKKIRINLNSLKKEMKKFQRANRGNFISSIHKNLSLDNKECIEILRLDSGKEKEEGMKRFLRKVLQSELKKLGKLAEEVLEENLKMLIETLEDKILEIEESISGEIKDFEKLEKSREAGIKERDLLLKSKMREKIMYLGIINERV
ncbi:hypothetical protein [Cetobacterium sp.]|uniref:hypothetical protein n=1 Tax=Cetobacterium sp. TaxID=2071632 RepID=UPI003EE73AD0